MLVRSASRGMVITTQAPVSFSDSFAVDQNPITSPWVKNCTACADVLIASGVATGARQTTANDDAYAWVATSSFSAPGDNYEIIVTMAEPGPDAMETEVLARVTDNGSGYFGYELLINGGGYTIVRIDGGIGGLYQIFDGTNGTPNTIGSFAASVVAGDKIKFTVTGTNPVRLRAAKALAASPTTFVEVLDVNDSSVSRRQTGQPGIGFYAANAPAVGDKGWADFSVVAV